MRLHIIVVGLDAVDNGLRLLIFAGDVDTDGDVAALDLVVDGLAQVVQQTRTLGDVHVSTEFGGHEARHMGDLYGMVQHVLAVARAVLHAAQELDNLGVQAVDIGLEHGALAFGLDGGVDLLLGLGNHFLNPGGMDTTVLDELFERQSRDFAPDGVKAGDGDRLGSIVDNQIAAGKGFDAADVAAFAADDAALHLVVGEGYDGDGDLTCVVGGTALDGGGDDFSRPLVRFFLVLGFHFLDLHGHFVGNVIADAVDEVGLGFLNRKAGDLFQHFELALLDHADLLLLLLGSGDLIGKGLILFLCGVQFLVQVLFLLLKAAFLLGQFCSAFLHFPLILGAVSVYLFLRLNKRLSLLALGALYSFVDDASGLFLGAGDLALSDLFTVHHAGGKARGGQDKHQYNR